MIEMGEAADRATEALAAAGRAWSRHMETVAQELREPFLRTTEQMRVAEIIGHVDRDPAQFVAYRRETALRCAERP